MKKSKDPDMESFKTNQTEEKPKTIRSWNTPIVLCKLHKTHNHSPHATWTGGFLLTSTPPPLPHHHMSHPPPSTPKAAGGFAFSSPLMTLVFLSSSPPLHPWMLNHMPSSWPSIPLLHGYKYQAIPPHFISHKHSQHTTLHFSL
ncbi:unnamed protein product [Rhodiola kirilowii]